MIGSPAVVSPLLTPLSRSKIAWYKLYYHSKYNMDHVIVELIRSNRVSCFTLHNVTDCSTWTFCTAKECTSSSIHRLSLKQGPYQWSDCLFLQKEADGKEGRWSCQSRSAAAKLSSMEGGSSVRRAVAWQSAASATFSQMSRIVDLPFLAFVCESSSLTSFLRCT